jgi:hypothetical protein
MDERVGEKNKKKKKEKRVKERERAKERERKRETDSPTLIVYIAVTHARIHKNVRETLTLRQQQLDDFLPFHAHHTQYSQLKGLTFHTHLYIYMYICI